ncbi:hypothetical protein B9Z55_029018 [Caenorhabditis nigoni]|uniref:ATP-dependent DNA helicase n=1 Tax=Caenorhabditis nigoni TaxID=1611254 RepID=A0A2G5S8X8_9PELO|nr:hypothetical protein B9Z55_029018 [Caenorhabditis nigoni]
MTCNPRWKEIQEALLPGQEPVDRPDIVSRVFKLKLEELKKDLFVKNIFGEVAAWIYVIEFQKRGTSRAAIHIYTDKNGVEHMTENEVNSYLDTRYVCAPESIWHIFDFRMSDRSTPVMQLKVHLKNAQGVVYKEGEEKDAAQRGQLRDTTLTAWFAANQRCYDELESTGMIPEDVVDLPRFLDDFAEDFVYKHFPKEKAEALAYNDLIVRMNAMGEKLEKWMSLGYERIMPDDVIDFDYCTKEGDRMRSTLVAEQEEVVKAVLDAVKSGGGLIYVDGPGGSGKTYVYLCLINILQGMHLKVIPIAWIGIAASLYCLMEERWLHSSI